MYLFDVLYFFYMVYSVVRFAEAFVWFVHYLFGKFFHCSVVVLSLLACPCVVSLFSAIVAIRLQCETFMLWAPVRVVAQSTWSGSGKLRFWFGPEFFHSLYRFFFDQLFSCVVTKASGFVFLLFFCSYVFCFINSIAFFISRVVSFLVLSRSFLSVIAVIFFEINCSTADMALKLHSFWISINLLHNSSGVSFTDWLAQTNLLGCGMC